MKTSEMIAMLGNNPKLRFKNITCDDYVYNSDGYITFERKNIPDSMSGGNWNGNVHVNYDWQLVREPVPVWEAIKALVDEGKTIIVKSASNEFKLNKDSLEGHFILYTNTLKYSTFYIEN